MRRNRRLIRTGLAEGIWFAVAALLFSMVVVPAVAKYPKNLNAAPHYAGTFTLFADPATAAPLAAPLQVPLTIDRRLRTIPGESGATRVVVDETIIQHAGDLVNTTQHNVYVMDRSTLRNVADSRAFAFDSSNPVNRSGSYRLNLPFDVKPTASLPIYDNEISGTYKMTGDRAHPTTNEAGLQLERFTGSVSEAPLSSAYLAELARTVPLPKSLTMIQLKPQLKQLGVDVDALLAALTPSLTPDDLATIGQLAFKPIQLQYVVSFTGSAAVEPMTGAQVDVAATQSVGARPLMTDLPALQTILRHYPHIAEATAADQALTKVASAPAVKLFSYSYEQTPESVAEVASQVKGMRSQLRMAKVYLPLGLLGVALVGFAVAAIAALTYRRGPGTPPTDQATVPLDVEPTPERELVTHGGTR